VEASGGDQIMKQKEEIDTTIESFISNFLPLMRLQNIMTIAWTPSPSYH